MPVIAEEDLLHVTLQLPVFNEMYVIERLINAVCEFDYPRNKLEIQVLDEHFHNDKHFGRICE